MNDENENKKKVETQTQEELYPELGDFIHIIGGRYNDTKGRIYYLDENLLRILPTGVADRLISIELEDASFKEEYEIEDLFIKKRLSPAFVDQRNYRVGQIGEAFLDSEPVGNFIIEDVNNKTDSITLRDSENETHIINFNFRGIPLDEGFDVLRSREAPVEKEEEDEVQDEEAEEEAIEEELTFEEEEVIQTVVGEITEIESSYRNYPDIVQRSDMLQEFISKLDIKSQKNPERIRNIRRLTELCLLLRNDIIQYDVNGIPLNKKDTSFTTLLDLASSQGELSRSVMNVKRVVYLDQEDSGNSTSTDIVIRSLSKELDVENTYSETEFAGNQNVANIIGNPLPNWYLGWEKYNKDFFLSWYAKDEENATAFQKDKDFFRMPFPEDEDTKDVHGLPKVPYPVKGIGAMPVTSDFLNSVYISVLRGLKGRDGRLKEVELPRTLESPEEATVDAYLLFPKLYERELGAIRSGKLAYDIGRSMRHINLIESILKERGGISNIPSVDSIVAVKNIGGHIAVEEWLKNLPLFIYGLGDALIELKSYGFANKEFYYKQQVVLIDKINSSIAHVKEHIQYIRKKAHEAEKPVPVNKNLITQESYEVLLDTLNDEPVLQNYISIIKNTIPSYVNNDIGIFSALFLYARDLMLAKIADSLGLAKYRAKAEIKHHLIALRQGLMLKEKSGILNEPEINKCPHVNSLNTIKKVKDDAQRMQLLAKYLTQYDGGKKDNFISCSVCKNSCLCNHEYLLLQEYLRPREKDTIHKELLLRFSDGVFQGKYICGNCGQPISSLEFDTSIEYSDTGAPMMGRAELIDENAKNQDEFDVLFGAELISVKEIKFDTDEKTLYYKKTRELFDIIGIFLDAEGYMRIVNGIDVRINERPARDTYAKAEKAAKAAGKRIDTYEVYINKSLIGTLLAYSILEIQTHIPNYVPRVANTGCTMDFRGYPLGNKEDTRVIDYFACISNLILRKYSQSVESTDPWRLCGFAPEKSIKTIASYITLVLSDILSLTEVQSLITKKKSYLIDTYGKSDESIGLEEIVPHGFTPVLYTETEVIVPEAANLYEKIRGYILETHKLAKDSVKKDLSAFSEKTCCLGPIQKANDFWNNQTLIALPPPSVPRGSINSHSLLPFVLRKQPILELNVAKEEYYKLFLKVCYQGVNIGLPHEFGYDKTCPYCDIKLPESDNGMGELQTQGVEINEESFKDLLNAVHLRNSVAQDPKPSIDIRTTYPVLLNITPAPFEEWRSLLQEAFLELEKLEVGEKEEYARIYGNISAYASNIFINIKDNNLLNDQDIETLTQLLKQPLRQVIESIQIAILLPLQRISTGYNLEQLTLPNTPSYKELKGQTIEKNINDFIYEHTNFIKQFTLSGFAKSKIQYAISQLSILLKTLQTYIRNPLIKGGLIGLSYIVKAGISSILYEMINPNIAVATNFIDNTSFDTSSRIPEIILKELLKKYRSESFKLTDEQIRIEIAKYNEKEKMSIISKFDRMDKESKTVELLKKKYGMGEWAVGGTKAIYAFDPDQYDKERAQRAEGEADAEAAAANDGAYDNEQVAEDDW